MKISNGIERNGIGPALHAALRKVCDSKATSAMYNAVEIVDERVWSLYLDAVWNALEKTEFDNQEMLGRLVHEAWKSVFDACDHDDPIAQEKKRLRNYQFAAEAQINLLYCIGEMMSDEDWIGFVGYLAHLANKEK
jgi:excinuclease UvrABC ATPase subunit